MFAVQSVVQFMRMRWEEHHKRERERVASPSQFYSLVCLPLVVVVVAAGPASGFVVRIAYTPRLPPDIFAVLLHSMQMKPNIVPGATFCVCVCVPRPPPLPHASYRYMFTPVPTHKDKVSQVLLALFVLCVSCCFPALRVNMPHKAAATFRNDSRCRRIQ